MQIQKRRQGYKQTQVGEIPEEWDIKSVDEIAELTMGQSPDGRSYNSDNVGVPLLNGPTEFGIDHPTAVQYTTEPTKLCKSHDILLCVRGSTTGRLNLADQEYCIGRGLASIRGIKKITNTMWLYYHFVRIQNKIYNIASGGGSTFPNINSDLIRKILLPYPTVEEQQKISSILSNVDELIQKTDQIIEQTQRLKKGLMQRLLTKGIGHTKFKKTVVGEIPDEWNIRKLEELGDLCAGGTPSRFTNSYWENGTVNWLSSGEVRNNVIYSSNEKITELGLSESAAKLFSKGTVLIAITGQGLTRGRTALLEIDSTTNQSVVGILCDKSIINNMFLWYYLQNQYWKLRSISQGSNQAGLNLELLNSYRILVPPLPEQQKIASVLSKVDDLLQDYGNTRSKVEYLKKGLMQKLLTGKIRVKV